MPVTKSDIDELRRMAVNTYDDHDKAFLNRVIHEVGVMEREILILKAELAANAKAK